MAWGSCGQAHLMSRSAARYRIGAVTRNIIHFAVLILAIVLAQPGHAQDREVPYWASIDAEEVNMRVGPSRDYPIDWVYKRKGLPVKVVRVREGWRLVQDPGGTQGWMVSSLLSARRGVLVIGEGIVDLREKPAEGSEVRWRAEAGVVGRLIRCEQQFCEIDISGRTGWGEQARLWGAGEP